MEAWDRRDTGYSSKDSPAPSVLTSRTGPRHRLERASFHWPATTCPGTKRPQTGVRTASSSSTSPEISSPPGESKGQPIATGIIQGRDLRQLRALPLGQQPTAAVYEVKATILRNPRGVNRYRSPLLQGQRLDRRRVYGRLCWAILPSCFQWLSLLRVVKLLRHSGFRRNPGFPTRKKRHWTATFLDSGFRRNDGNKTVALPGPNLTTLPKVARPRLLLSPSVVHHEAR